MGIACAASCLGASTLPTETIDSVCPAIYKAGPCLEDACHSACDNDPYLSDTAVDECHKSCESDNMSDAQKEKEIKSAMLTFTRATGAFARTTQIRIRATALALDFRASSTSGP